MGSTNHVQMGAGKTGSICHLRVFPLRYSIRAPKYPEAGINSTKIVIVTPFLCVPQMLVEQGLESAVPIC